MEPLLPECSYHIYNHTNGNDMMFKEEDNYLFFLKKYQKHIVPVANTFAYCLMRNHFHILIKIKKEMEIVPLLTPIAEKKYLAAKSPEEKESVLSLFVSKQFSNLFSAYTQAFNKMYFRMGSLFMKNFKRKPIHDEEYFLRLIYYINTNPVKHKQVVKPEEWKFSSYNAILSNNPTLVERQAVLELFGGRENFRYVHLEGLG